MKEKWDLIAEDYYSSFHITTRNFDAVINAHFPDYLSKIDASGLILEVGGGKGRLKKFLSLRDGQWLVADISLAMMRAAQLSKKETPQYIQMTALACPFRNCSFTAIASLLGDSFATKSAFQEFFRVLKPSGTLLISNPSLMWGKALRESLGVDRNQTVIPTKRHGPIYVPSFLYGEDELTRVLQEVGFRVEEVASFGAEGVIRNRSDFSEHILISSSALEIPPEKLPLVTFAIAKRT